MHPYERQDCNHQQVELAKPLGSSAACLSERYQRRQQMGMLELSATRGQTLQQLKPTALGHSSVDVLRQQL